MSAASRATSLVSRVVLTEPRTSRMACSLACWSEPILSMASASFAMASSFLRAPLSMASTTLVKSLTTDTLIVELISGASSWHEVRNAGTASSMVMASGMNFLRFMSLWAPP